MSDLVQMISRRCEARAQDDLFLRHAEAVAVIRAVVARHAEYPPGWCVTCGGDFPCVTLQDVAGALGVCVDQPEKD